MIAPQQSQVFLLQHPTGDTSKKRVILKPTVLVHEITINPLTTEEKSGLYLTRDEFDKTILEVDAIALSNQVKNCGQNNNDMLDKEPDGLLRGIESRAYPQRLQNRLMARRALLKFQAYLQNKKKGSTPEQKAEALRKASEKLSTRSQFIAVETARFDSLRAYDADYLIPLDHKPLQMSHNLDLASRKRRREEVQDVAGELSHQFKKVTTPR